MTQIDKLNQLLKSDQKLFHTQDLALLWDVDNRNTLYTAIKRYIKKGVLIKITKGLYSIKHLKHIENEELGSALINKYCYLSCQSVLKKEGVIFQVIYPTIFITSISKKIEVGKHLFIYKQIKKQFLLNREGVKKENGYFVASKERAVADIMYYNPKFYFDCQDLIDWERVKDIQKKVGY